MELDIYEIRSQSTMQNVNYFKSNYCVPIQHFIYIYDDDDADDVIKTMNFHIKHT